MSHFEEQLMRIKSNTKTTVQDMDTCIHAIEKSIGKGQSKSCWIGFLHSRGERQREVQISRERQRTGVQISRERRPAEAQISMERWLAILQI
jgi:hypothetical protein